MLHVGFTGTRFGATELQLARMRALLDTLAGQPVTAHHGDCVGADAQFHTLARERRWTIVVHPPVDDTDRARCDHDELRDALTHMKRNKQIVTEAHLMLAAPRDMTEQAYGGTWKTIGMTRKAKKPLVIVFPDGSTEGAWP